MMQIYKNIGIISEEAATRALEGKHDACVELSKAASILTSCFVQLKEVEIHEKYHVEQMNILPGEAPLNGPAN